jgi:hypothetical protein
MWLHRFTKYLLTHRWQALVITFLTALISTFIPILGIISIAIAALMTLLKNAIEGAIFTAAATLPYFLAVFYTPQIPLALWAGVGVAVVSNVLTYVFAIMLLRKTSWSQLIQIAALIGVFVVSVLHLIYPHLADWWGTQLQAYYAQAKDALNLIASNSGDRKNDQYLLETINITKQYATGLMAAAILFNAVLQLIVARWWQAIVFVPGLLKMELHNIRLSQLAGILFILSIGLAYWGNSVVLDIMPILYLLFAMAGLSLIHFSFALMHSKTRLFWLAIVYLALIFSLPTSVFFIAMIGLLDIWFDLRHKLKMRRS